MRNEYLFRRQPLISECAEAGAVNNRRAAGGCGFRLFANGPKVVKRMAGAANPQITDDVLTESRASAREYCRQQVDERDARESVLNPPNHCRRNSCRASSPGRPQGATPGLRVQFALG